MCLLREAHPSGTPNIRVVRAAWATWILATKHTVLIFGIIVEPLAKTNLVAQFDAPACLKYAALSVYNPNHSRNPSLQHDPRRPKMRDTVSQAAKTQFCGSSEIDQLASVPPSVYGHKLNRHTKVRGIGPF
jgi:hypothetical protein